MKSEESQEPLSKQEQQIQDEFSQDWLIYKVATHEKGGIHLIAEMEYKYSLKQLNDMHEALRVYDAIKKIGHDKAKAEAKKKQK